MARSQISAQLGREDGWMISHQSPAYPHRNQKAVLILNLQDGVAYTTFLNAFLLGRFKFFLVEVKVTTLTDVLRRAQDFIKVIEICDGDDFVWQNTWTRVREDNDLQSNQRPRTD